MGWDAGLQQAGNRSPSGVWATSSCAMSPPSGFKERKECLPDEKFRVQPPGVSVLVRGSLNHVQAPEGSKEITNSLIHLFYQKL